MRVLFNKWGEDWAPMALPSNLLLSYINHSAIMSLFFNVRSSKWILKWMVWIIMNDGKFINYIKMVLPFLALLSEIQLFF